MTDVGFDLIDAFDEAEVAPRALVTGGRYRLPNRDGSHHPGGWMRVTNLVGAYADVRALALWQMRMTLLGLRDRHDLYEELCSMPVDKMDRKTLKKALEYLADQAQSAAKADVGRRRGTARHDMVAHFHEAGEVIGTPDMRIQLAEYNALLAAHKLVPVPGLQERVVLIESLAAAGRLDNVLIDNADGTMTGPRRIGDLKTQRRFWTLLEVQAQLACYSRADAMWDEHAERYVDMPAVDQELGHAMHMPQEPDEAGNPRPLAILNIDLVKGWRTAQHALVVVRERSEYKRVGTLAAAIRPLPAPALSVVRSVEEYAARFAAVATAAEGSALVAEVRRVGLWGPELRVCAENAARRLAGP